MDHIKEAFQNAKVKLQEIYAKVPTLFKFAVVFFLGLSIGSSL